MAEVRGGLHRHKPLPGEVYRRTGWGKVEIRGIRHHYKRIARKGLTMDFGFNPGNPACRGFGPGGIT